MVSRSVILATPASFMMTTAHPDDENNGLLVMLNRGQGYRTTLATATRGNGGQNEIGPEIFEALACCVPEELHALHRFDGAEQHFTRAVDFGSRSAWRRRSRRGHDEVLGDFCPSHSHDSTRDVMAGLEHDRRRRWSAPPDVSATRCRSVQDCQRPDEVS